MTKPICGHEMSTQAHNSNEPGVKNLRNEPGVNSNEPGVKPEGQSWPNG